MALDKLLDADDAVVIVVAVRGRSPVSAAGSPYCCGLLPPLSSILRILDFSSSSSSQTVDGAVVETTESAGSAYAEPGSLDLDRSKFEAALNDSLLSAPAADCLCCVESDACGVVCSTAMADALTEVLASCLLLARTLDICDGWRWYDPSAPIGDDCVYSCLEKLRSCAMRL